MNGENSDEWIYDIVPEEQVNSIRDSMRKINDDETTIFNILLCAPRSSAIELCRRFGKTLTGDLTSTAFIMQFMKNIVELVEEELYEDGINPYEEC
jgi:hypothetical protein